MRSLIPAVLFFLLHTGLRAQQPFRTFTSSSGSTMRASLVDVDYDKTGKATAILRRQGTGTNLRVQVEQLSEADRAYIASMADWLRAPQSLRGRLTVESRDEVRKSAGSSAAAESAVEKALLWLTARQNPDGSWGTTYAPAMTGLALLALTGQGHGADSARYGRHIASGTAYLSALGAKNSNPFEGVLSNKPAVVTSVYEHAIATQALAEVLALAKISNTVPAGLDSVTANAERIILTAQAPNGAWGYKDGIGYDRYGANDLCVSGWQIQAIAACRTAGIEANQRSAVLRKARDYFLSKSSSDGGFGATDRASHYNQWCLTGSTLGALLETGAKPGDRALVKGTLWLKGVLTREPLSWSNDCRLHAWYFDSLAMRQLGDDAWQAWNNQGEQVLIASQSPDGSWPQEKTGELTAIGSAGAGSDKDIYRVCLATLILESPYRFTPRPEKAK